MIAHEGRGPRGIAGLDRPEQGYLVVKSGLAQHRIVLLIDVSTDSHIPQQTDQESADEAEQPVFTQTSQFFMEIEFRLSGISTNETELG